MTLLAGYRPPGATLAAFLADKCSVRALIGPHGGGRKVCAVVDIARRINAAPPGRWMVGCATAKADDLTITVMRAVAETFGKDIGQWDMQARRFAIDWKAQDGRRQVEFLFCGIDKPQQRAELERSNPDMVWLAGARDLSLDVLDLAVELTGAAQPGRAALIVTSRMPSAEHWIASKFTTAGQNWRLHRQPGGRTERAENVANLKPDFYNRLADRHDAASEVDAEWRQSSVQMGEIDPRRLALAVLWHHRGGFPPDDRSQRLRP